VPITPGDFAPEVVDLIARIDDLATLMNAEADVDEWDTMAIAMEVMQARLLDLRDTLQAEVLTIQAIIQGIRDQHDELGIDISDATQAVIDAHQVIIEELEELIALAPTVELLPRPVPTVVQPPAEPLEIQIGSRVVWMTEQGEFAGVVTDGPRPSGSFPGESLWLVDLDFGDPQWLEGRDLRLEILAFPVPIPEPPDFGLSDLLDPEFWAGLFSDVAGTAFGVHVTIPTQILRAWTGLAEWDDAIYRKLLNMPAELDEQSETAQSTWWGWGLGEVEGLFERFVRGAESTVADALGPIAAFFNIDSIADVFEVISHPIGTALSFGLTTFMDSLEELGRLYFAPISSILDEMLDNLPPELRSMLDVQNPTSAWFAVILAAITGGLVGGTLGRSLNAWLAPAGWWANEKWRPRLLGEDDLSILTFRWPERIPEWETEMANLGIADWKWNALIAARRELPIPRELELAFHRGEIDEEEALRRLRHLSYTHENAQLLMATWPTLPGVSDVVRFGVREVYRPEIVRAFQLDQDFPSLGEADWTRIGLATEEFEKYWRAHWELPSISQTFEMFHRTTLDPIDGFSQEVQLADGSTVWRIISEDRVAELLRVADVMPAWRDPLVRIAFTPFTRVDIRRFYRTGVMDLAGVQRAYLDIGYSEENALVQAEFVVGLETEKTFDELETILGGRAVDGTIEVENALLELFVIDVPDRVQEGAERRMRARVDRARAQDRVGSWRAALRFERVDELEFREALAELEIPVATVDHLVAVEATRRGVDVLGAANTEIRASGRTAPARRFREGLTDVTEFRSELEALGYAGEQLARLEGIAVLDRSTALALDTLSAYRAGLRTGRLSELEFRTALAKLGIARDFIGMYVESDLLRRKLEDPTDEEQELRGTGRGTSLARFREGWTTEGEFSSEMAALGYTAQEAEQYATVAQLAFDFDWKSDMLRLLGEQLTRGEIDGEGYLGRLATLGMDPARAQTHLARLQASLIPRIRPVVRVEALPRYRTPAGKAQVQLAREEFRALLIDEAELTARLANLEMSPELVRSTVELETFRRVRRVELREAPVPALYQTDAGEIRIRTLREAFRGGFIVSDQLRANLAELEVPADVADEMVEFEVTRLAARRREAPVEPVATYLTPAGRDQVRLAIDLFRSGVIDGTELAGRFRELQMPDDLVGAKVELEEFRLVSRVAIPDPLVIPYWQTDEGRVQTLTIREAFRQGLIDSDQHLQLLVDLEVEQGLAEAMTAHEVGLKG
jgi:hypothetical protein